MEGVQGWQVAEDGGLFPLQLLREVGALHLAQVDLDGIAEVLDVRLLRLLDLCHNEPDEKNTYTYV